MALVLCGGWLMARRLAGAFVNPLADAQLIGAGALAVLCAAAARLMWWHAREIPQRAWCTRALDWLPTVALVLVGAAAALPGNSLAAVLLLWAMIAAEEFAAGLLGRSPRGAIQATSMAVGPHFPGSSQPRVRNYQAFEPNSETRPAEVWQQLTRERSADGREMVHGTLRTAFSIGQRTAIEHLVFSPMLTRAPRITAVALDESDCSVRTTHVYRYGARLEIKLREPCEEACEVLVRYEAIS